MEWMIVCRCLSSSNMVDRLGPSPQVFSSNLLLMIGLKINQSKYQIFCFWKILALTCRRKLFTICLVFFVCDLLFQIFLGSLKFAKNIFLNKPSNILQSAKGFRTKCCILESYQRKYKKYQKYFEYLNIQSKYSFII